MLYSIAETCTKLHILDISYSTEVTDLGLLYLCGASGRCGLGLDRFDHIFDFDFANSFLQDLNSRVFPNENS